MKKLYLILAAAASFLLVSCEKQESFDHELLFGTWDLDTYMDAMDGANVEKRRMTIDMFGHCHTVYLESNTVVVWNYTIEGTRILFLSEDGQRSEQATLLKVNEDELLLDYGYAKLYFQRFVYDSRAVDMGLSVLWASVNVGTTEPLEAGAHAAWGQVGGKNLFNWSTYAWFDGTDSVITKYTTHSHNGHQPDNITTIELADDMARDAWGKGWRMPTMAEWEELLNDCEWQWYGEGYQVTGPSGQSIILPAAGYHIEDNYVTKGQVGIYWSSTLSTISSTDEGAMAVVMDDVKVEVTNYIRYIGASIRPVYE